MAQIRSVRRVAQVLLALGSVACGGGDKPANSQAFPTQQCPPGQYFDGQICQTPGAATGQPQPQGTPATGTPAGGIPTAGTPTVAAPPIATSAAGSPAQPLDATAAAAATQLLTALAQSSAPGAKPVGSAVAGNFTQGQILETQVQMNPGKCYTVVGAALPTVTNLDIEIVPVMPIPGLAPVLATDQTQGSTAVVAPAPNCYKWALPVGAPVKIVLRVSAGQGMAAAQVYEK